LSTSLCERIFLLESESYNQTELSADEQVNIMCGRVAQTVGVVSIAARKFSTSSCTEAFMMPPTATFCGPPGDNFNLSPGMDCDVMLVDENGDFQVDRKKWGLITKSGTAKKPLYIDGSEIIKLCFESLCFNARSETLYSKPTFSKLAYRGRTCIIALDGYFEWKSYPIPKINKTKQPYFVYRKQQLDRDAGKQEGKKGTLLIAGLWTRVTTGILDAPELGSFAMLTTDASEQIKWLHHRMPLCIWDIDLAKQWLTQPSEALKKKLDDAARCETNGFGWHKVTSEMSKLSFRSKEAITELKETTQSIRHFFASGGSLAKKTGKKDHHEVKKTSHNKSTVTPTDATPSTTRDGKRISNLSSTYSSPNKKQNFKKRKLGRSPILNSNKQIQIDSFFQKKKK
jgi:putative SOS response-associated peptidase YedK